MTVLSVVILVAGSVLPPLQSNEKVNVFGSGRIDFT